MGSPMVYSCNDGMVSMEGEEYHSQEENEKIKQLLIERCSSNLRIEFGVRLDLNKLINYCINLFLYLMQFSLSKNLS